MFTINNLIQPKTMEEAYKILTEKRNNTVLGGCCFLRMGAKRIGTAVELSKLNLNYIKEDTEFIEIGAYTTFRDLETSPLLKEYFNGIIPKSVADIIGVQFRNVVTVGASVFSKYGFSDLLPSLLVLDCEVELYKMGRMHLSEFLARPFEKDILTKIFIKKSNKKAVYVNFRNAKSDFSILNAAVSLCDGKYSIALGARPRGAEIAKKASEYMSNMSNASIEDAALIASEELVFGSNMRASGEYRKSLSKALVKKALKEVSEWK